MTLEVLAELGEFVSGIGVFATIVYALFEYRRARTEREMQAAYEGEIAWSDFNLEIAKDPALASLSVRSFAPDADAAAFSAEELAQVNFMGRAFLHRLEAQWFVSKRRGLPPEIWQKRRIWGRAYIEAPMGRMNWERDKASGNLTPAFIREVESAPLIAILPR